MRALSKTSITAGIATLALAGSLFSGATMATAAPVDQGASAQGATRCAQLFQQAGAHLSGTCDTVRGHFVDADGDGVCDNTNSGNGQGQGRGGHHGSNSGNGSGHGQGAGGHHGCA